LGRHRSSNSRRRKIFLATPLPSERLQVEEPPPELPPKGAPAWGDVPSEDGAPPPLPPKSAWFPEEDEEPDLAKSLPILVSLEDVVVQPRKKPRTKPAYLRLYQSKSTMNVDELKERKERRKKDVAKAEERRDEEKKRIREEQQARKDELLQSKNDRRARKRLQTSHQRELFTSSMRPGEAADFWDLIQPERAKSKGEESEPAEPAEAAEEFEVESSKATATFASTSYPETEAGDEENDDWFDDESDLSGEEEVATVPVSVNLPRWFPEKVPLATLDPVLGHVKEGQLKEPTPPVVKCIGAGKILVHWDLPTPCPVSAMWHVRLRGAADGADKWLTVDMDSGRADRSEATSWKNRALVVQPGLHVWSYCIEDGGKSSEPKIGTIVAHHPGLVVVDFDSLGRQRVPQDWIQYASTAKAAHELPGEIISFMKEKAVVAANPAGPTKAEQLWQKAQKDWWQASDGDAQKNERSRRQCPVIYADALDDPVPGDRVALGCAMLSTQAGSSSNPESRGSETSRPGSSRQKAVWPPFGVGQPAAGDEAPALASESASPERARFHLNRCSTSSIDFGLMDKTESKMLYTWWPAVRCEEAGAAEGEDSDVERDRPADLCVTTDVPVVLEPWPRVQVIPRSFMNGRASHQANIAARNSCPGQQVLAHYRPTLDLVPSEELEESLRHPEHERAGEITLLEGGVNFSDVPSVFHPPPRSERGVRAEVLREFVSAAETFVHVRFRKTKDTPAKSAKIPLRAITEILASREERMTRKSYDKKMLHGWIFERDDAKKIKVFAVHRLVTDGSIQDPAQLLEGLDVMSKIGPDGKQPKRAMQAKVVRISARTTHYEVRFEDVVPSSVQHVSSEMLEAVWEEDGPNRWKQPTVVVHDLPDDLASVEVQVGVSSGMGSTAGVEVIWSKASQRCTVQTPNQMLFAPAGPAGFPTGISKAEVCWLCPDSPAPLCFRLRMREVSSKRLGRIKEAPEESWRVVDDNYRGSSLARLRDDTSGDYWVEQEGGSYAEQAWSYISSLGRETELETTMAWQNRIIPLAVHQWVLAYGQIEGQKTATPSPAVVYEICDDTNVKVQFAHHAQELMLGGEEMAQMVETDDDSLTTPVEVPIEWIDAVWVQDGQHFFKGKPSVTCKASQKVRFEKEFEGYYSAFIGDSEEPVDGLGAESMVIKEFKGQKVQDGVYAATAMLGSVALRGLEPKRDYELCVQALTEEGWTAWTELGVLRMPKTAYEQEELVVERQANALYKSPLLPHAFYKEYPLCRETIHNALTQDRYARLKHALEWEVDKVDPKFRGWLVNMNGPVRESAKMSVPEVRAALRKAVERGADVNHRDQSTGRTPLLLAVEYFRYINKIEVIKELIALKANADAMNDARQTALASAAERGHDNIVTYLLNECGADATIINLNGRTAYLKAQVEFTMSDKERAGVRRCRELLAETRVPWEVFEREVIQVAEANPDDPEKLATAFLQLAFPDLANPKKSQLFITDPQTKLGKRICKFDRLRLYEQIEEAAATDPEERLRRGRLCGEKLLLPMMHAASTPPQKKNTGLLTWYLLFSDVARFVITDVRAKATELLGEHQGQLTELHDALLILPTLTQTATSYPETTGGTREMYNGNVLHQWHAHSDLDWLTQRNVVNAFEALVVGGAFKSLEAFCAWTGELNALISACDPDDMVKPGNWDPRLPDVFWGAVYVQWLLSEADRCAPIFHEIAQSVVDAANLQVGGIKYETAPNKGKARVETKQKDYASPGLHILHEALDLLPGCFAKVLRADLGASLKEALPNRPAEVTAAAPILIVGELAPLAAVPSTALSTALYAVTTLKKQADEAERQAKEAAANGQTLPEAEELEKTLNALRRTTFAQLTEMRALGNPPPRILKAAEAASVLLSGASKKAGRRASSSADAAPMPQGSSSPSVSTWGAFAQDVLSIGVDAFRKLFEDFDKDSVTGDMIAKLEPIVKNKDFQPQAFNKAENKSGISLLRPLASWIHAVYTYYQAARQKGLALSRSFSFSTAANGEVEVQVVRPSIIVALIRYPGATDEMFEEHRAKLLEAGADAVVGRRNGELEGGGARQLLAEGLNAARLARGLPEEPLPPTGSISSERAQILFEMRKCNSAYSGDLLCAGGLLDLVRGSIVCTQEDQVRAVFNKAMTLTIKDHGCEVVRIKNGFHTPAVGGYCDLKLFLFIAREVNTGFRKDSKCYHVCELQVHMQSFLDCKQYTHLPYQADRGDFDPS